MYFHFHDGNTNLGMNVFHYGNENEMKVPGWRQEMKIRKWKYFHWQNENGNPEMNDSHRGLSYFHFRGT